jgi:CheY-like chemotaxis protein
VSFIPFSYHFLSLAPTALLDHPFVASILISEPNAEVRALLELLVARLGHRPLRAEELEDGAEPELVLLEPASSAGLALAKRLRRRFAHLPIVCASILPPGPELKEIEPVTYLVKPVRLRELEDAIASALRV